MRVVELFRIQPCSRHLSCGSLCISRSMLSFFPDRSRLFITCSRSLQPFLYNFLYIIPSLPQHPVHLIFSTPRPTSLIRHSPRSPISRLPLRLLRPFYFPDLHSLLLAQQGRPLIKWLPPRNQNSRNSVHNAFRVALRCHGYDIAGQDGGGRVIHQEVVEACEALVSSWVSAHETEGMNHI